MKANEIDIAYARQKLSELQAKKLNLAARIIKQTAELYDGDQRVLPIWAAGVITHGQPKKKYYEIGITKTAQNADRKDQARDHLYRVTATVEYLLKRAEQLSVTQIEDILLARAAVMVTTRNENNHKLKKALKLCSDKDDWKTLYNAAGIEYDLYAEQKRRERTKRSNRLR